MSPTYLMGTLIIMGSGVLATYFGLPWWQTGILICVYEFGRNVQRLETRR